MMVVAVVMVVVVVRWERRWVLDKERMMDDGWRTTGWRMTDDNGRVGR